MDPQQHGQTPPGDSSKIIAVDILGFKTLEIVGHAKDQMKIREIGIQDIIMTLKEPDKTDLPTQPGRFRYRRNKTIRIAIDVVFEKLADRIRVITAISKIRRLVERNS